jgi:hypothetical protein
MTLWAGVLGDGAIGGQEPRGVAWGFAPLHAMFPLARQPLRMLSPVMEIAPLAVFHSLQNLTHSRAVALHLIRNDVPRHMLQLFEPFAEQLLRRFCVVAALHQGVEDVIVLVHSSPSVITLTVDGQTQLVKMPCVPSPRQPAP